jgi:hypothetical protein
MNIKPNAISAILMSVLFCCSGCGIVNLGRWKGLERTAADEKFYLAKEMFLAAGSTRKEVFDHTMHEAVSLCFIPANERNHYLLESVWTDPSGQEFRKIRQTYDVNAEQRKGEERSKGGTMRVQAMSTAELAQHKPGMWKVALYLDDQLVRKMTFFVK